MSNTDVVKSFQRLMADGNTDQAFDLIADDAVWHSDKIDAPWSGSFEGKKEVIRHFSLIQGSTIDFTRKTDRFIEDGNLVIEIGCLSCILTKTKQPFDTQYVCIYCVEDNQISRYCIYEDSLKLYRAYHAD